MTRNGPHPNSQACAHVKVVLSDSAFHKICLPGSIATYAVTPWRAVTRHFLPCKICHASHNNRFKTRQKREKPSHKRFMSFWLELFSLARLVCIAMPLNGYCFPASKALGAARTVCTSLGGHPLPLWRKCACERAVASIVMNQDPGKRYSKHLAELSPSFLGTISR